MKIIWKGVASLLATIFLLAIFAFVFTSLLLTRQPGAHLQFAYAAGPTLTAQVTSTPFVAGVYRFGINTGTNDSLGPGDFMANMFDNPGFEPISESHLIIIGNDATSSTFTDASDPSLGGGYAPTKYPTGFWNGGKASVRTGAAAGDQFTITSYKLDGSYTFGSCLDTTANSITCPRLAKGAAVAEVQTGTTLWAGIQSGGGIAGDWFTHDANCNYSTVHVYDGRGSLACNVADGEDHVVHYIWDLASSKGGVCSSDNVTPCTVAKQTTDCGGGNTCLLAPEAGPWHPVKGAFEIAFWAMGSGTSTGTPKVRVALARAGGTNVSHTFALTNDGNWHQYVYPFTGTDVSWKGGQNQQQLNFTFSTTNTSAEAGATIYIDDAYLGKQAASTTGFRSEFVTTLQALNPGSIRLMGGGTMAASRAALEGLSGCTPGQGAAPDTPGTCDFQHGPANAANTSGGQWTYSSANLYPLANQLGSAPWFSISNAFSDADLRTFIDNACTALSTYTRIPSIWIEQSNEEWNIGSPSYTIRYGSNNLGTGPLGYGGESGRNFSVMRAEATAKCPSSAIKFHYIMGNQLCNAGVIGAAMQGAANAGYPIPNTSQYGTAGASYYGGNLPAESGSLAAQAAAYATLFFSYIPPYYGKQGKGCINAGGGADWAFIGSNNTESIYETAPNAYNGPGTIEQGYLSQAGYPSAAWMAEGWLMAQQGYNESGGGPKGRVPVQNDFTLTQTEFGIAPIWGIVHDLDSDFGPRFPHLRSIGVGEEVVNSAVQQGGALFAVTGGPGSVVVNPYNSNSSGTGMWSAALVNTSQSATAYSLTFLASGTVPGRCEATVNANGITDNNENSNDVAVGSCTSFSCTGQTCSVTLQPDQVVAMDPTVEATRPSRLVPRLQQPPQ
jgi:hypothetical protein